MMASFIATLQEDTDKKQWGAADAVEPLSDSEVELPALITNLTRIMDDPAKQRIGEIVLKAAIRAKYHEMVRKPKCLEDINALRSLRDKLVTIVGFRNYPKNSKPVLAFGA